MVWEEPTPGRFSPFTSRVPGRSRASTGFGVEPLTSQSSFRRVKIPDLHSPSGFAHGRCVRELENRVALESAGRPVAVVD